MRDFSTGKLILSAGAAASAKSGADIQEEPVKIQRKGYRLYPPSESGAAATATVRLLWVSVDSGLN